MGMREDAPGPHDPERSLLSSLPDEVRALVWMSGVERTVAAGDQLYGQGGDDDHAFVVLNGVLKVAMISLDGDDVLLALRTSGELAGQFEAIDGERRLASAEAVVDSEVLELQAPAFRDLIARRPALAAAIMQGLTRQVRDMANHLLQLSRVDTTALIARRVVQLATDPRLETMRTQADGVTVIEPALSQQDLAGWSGVSHRSAAAALQEFRAQGWVETGRLRIAVLDLDGLVERSEALTGP